MWFVLHVMDYKQITTPCCNCQLLSLRKMNDWKIQKQIQKRREGKRKKSSRKNIGKICSIFEKYCHFSSKMCKQYYRTFTFTIRAQSFTYYFIEVRSLSRHKQRFYIQQKAQGFLLDKKKLYLYFERDTYAINEVNDWILSIWKNWKKSNSFFNCLIHRRHLYWKYI